MLIAARTLMEQADVAECGGDAEKCCALKAATSDIWWELDTCVAEGVGLPDQWNRY